MGTGSVLAVGVFLVGIALCLWGLVGVWNKQGYRGLVGRFDVVGSASGMVCIVLLALLAYIGGRYGLASGQLAKNPAKVSYMLVLIILQFLPNLLGALIVVHSFLALYHRSVRRFWVSSVIGVVVLACAALVPPITLFLRGYAVYLRTEMDPAALQQWAVQSMDTLLPDHAAPVPANAPGLGSFEFDRGTVWAYQDASKSYVQLMKHWGSGEYGLMVGSRDFQCWKGDYELAPGVCVYVR